MKPPVSLRICLYQEEATAIADVSAQILKVSPNEADVTQQL